MNALSYAILSLGMLASITALFHAGTRRSHIAYLQRSRTACTILRALSWVLLASTFGAAGSLIGWELAVPVWLSLLSIMGIASLFLAALSRQWHLVFGVVSGGMALIGWSVTAISG